MLSAMWYAAGWEGLAVIRHANLYATCIKHPRAFLHTSVKLYMREVGRLLKVYNSLKVLAAEAEPTACAITRVAHNTVGQNYAAIECVVLMSWLKQSYWTSCSLVERYILTYHVAALAVAESCGADVGRLLQVTGPDESEAASTIEELFNSKFEEE